MRRVLLIAIVAFMLPARLPAPLVCYNTDCLPSVDRVDPSAKAPMCPKEFRAHNYAKSTGGEETWSAVCAESGPWIYGGLSFYDGEGISGTGGLLRLDRTTRAVEVRRLALLRNVSINSIAADGDVVWFGTTQNGECVGQPFVHGLVRYDWRARDVKTYEGSDDGPIGFSINDLVLRDASLWVATDLGLSRLDLATNTWHHFNAAKEERSAKEILGPLLRTVPRECLRSETFENQLVEGLAKFRPRFLNAYLDGIPAGEWQCPELRFMTSRMNNFATLNRRVLRFDPPGSRFFACAVEGFVTHRHVERKWRDLLVAEWRKRPDSFTPAAFRFFRGDKEIAQMLIASRYRAIAVVPEILGEDAIPLLRERLQNSDELESAAAIYGLELVSHTRLSPDGRIQKIASAGTLRDFLDQRWFQWSADQQQAVIAGWSKLILPAHER